MRSKIIIFFILLSLIIMPSAWAFIPDAPSVSVSPTQENVGDLAQADSISSVDSHFLQKIYTDVDGWLTTLPYKQRRAMKKIMNRLTLSLSRQLA